MKSRQTSVLFFKRSKVTFKRLDFPEKVSFKKWVLKTWKNCTVKIDMGVSLNGGTSKTLGKPRVVGYHHFGKPPYHRISTTLSRSIHVFSHPKLIISGRHAKKCHTIWHVNSFKIHIHDPQTHNNIECGTWSLPVKGGVILDFQEYIVQSKCGLIGWIIRMQRMAYWVLVVYNPLYKLNNQSLGHSLSQVGSTHRQEIDGKMDQKFRRSFPLSSTACKGLYHATAPVTGSWSWSWVVAEESGSVAVAEDASVRTISSP